MSAGGEGDPAPHAGRAVAALCLAQFVDVLGVTVVITALPSILHGLDAPESAASLVATAYAMLFGGLLMLGARLGDRYGHRRVLIAGLVLFGAASALAAVATSVTLLLIARGLQGAAAAASVPTALSLLSVVAPEGRMRRRALAAWSAAGAAAGASGFVLGGVLTDLAGWEAVFWFNVPLAVALVAAIVRWVPMAGGDARGRLDVPGALTLTAGVMALVLGSSLLEREGERALGGLLVLFGGALVLVFAAVERRASAPLLPARAARDRGLRLGAGAAFVNTATTSSVVTLATLYLQDVRDVGPAAAGAWLLSFSVAVIGGSSLAAPLLRRASPRATISLGLTLIAAGNAALLLSTSQLWTMPFALAVSGAGIGLSSVAANEVGLEVPEEIRGAASGLLNTAAQVGTAIGVAAFLLLAALTEDGDLPLAGTELAWGGAALLAATVAAVVWAGGSAPRTRREPSARPASSGSSRRGG